VNGNDLLFSTYSYFILYNVRYRHTQVLRELDCSVLVCAGFSWVSSFYFHEKIVYRVQVGFSILFPVLLKRAVCGNKPCSGFVLAGYFEAGANRLVAVLLELTTPSTLSLVVIVVVFPNFPRQKREGSRD
jgi:hypothetical protein